ncbi:MAG: penicillin-binding protein 2 [Betaproteobacteria bacterium]|jgi:penicillin-binding protein 2|nr:penicillin-binding protein 2 [Candidatus Binatia bacterium]
MAPLANISKQDGAPELRRRSQLLFIFIAVAFLGLITRLVFLQIVEGERFTYLSENNRIRIKRVPGTRGMIFDREGQLLVDSRPSFDLIFVPEDSERPETTLKLLAGYLRRDPVELLKTFEENKNRAAFDELVLGRDIDWPAVVAVETHQLELPGVSLRARPRRNYSDGPMAAHVLGYLGEINQKQLKLLKDQGYVLGDEIGQYGLERRWEELLRGQSGGQQVEVDALGRRVRVLHEVTDVPGYTVHLTLDRQLQETAYEALKGKEGTIVALDVHSGAILALASTPAFDPNTFARGIKADEWSGLIKDQLRPLSNRATQGQYPPGSTFKIVMSIAGLEEGVIQPESFIQDPGFYSFGNRSFRDWKKGGHGAVNLHKAIVESCDTYFYQLGPKLGIDRIAKWANAFGLGEKTGIALDDERSGTIPSTEWKRKRYRQPWFPGETVSVAIGQGYVTVTPLQLANMMAAVANGGKLYRPYVVNKVESVDGATVREYGPEVIRTIELKPDTLKRVRAALADVVSAPHGTGAAARSEVVSIAGKTGTAQVVEMKGGYVKTEQLAYFNRDHAWFVSYAPVENPQVAIAVLVEHGGHGGDAAAPMAKKVFEKFIEVQKQSTDKQQVKVDGESRAN